MKNRIQLVLMVLLLAGGLFMLPVYRATAQSEEPAAETQDDHARGLGSVIIIVGVLTVAGVGALYMMRQQSSEA